MGEGGGEGGQQLFDLSDCSDRPHTVHRRPHSCKIEKMLQRGEGGHYSTQGHNQFRNGGGEGWRFLEAKFVKANN